jgi:hypothetical protein
MIIGMPFTKFLFFYADRKSKMAAIAGHRLTLNPSSHVEYPTGTKNRKFVENHPRNIPAKFGSNWPSGFGEEARNVKSLQTTDNRRRTPSDGNSSPGIISFAEMGISVRYGGRH